MDAGNEGVDEEHENHHGQDGHALHQQNLVSYSVLWGGGEKNVLFYRPTVCVCLEWSGGEEADIITEIRSTQRSHRGLSDESGLKHEPVPSSAVPGCFAPSFCLPEKFVCPKQNKTKMYSVLFLCHHLDPTEPWLLIITKPVCKTDPQTYAGCCSAPCYVLRVVFLYLLQLLNCVFVMIAPPARQNKTRQISFSVLKINETKREIYIKCLSVFFEKI